MSGAKELVASLNNGADKAKQCADAMQKSDIDAKESVIEATWWGLLMKLTTFVQHGKENGMSEDSLKPFVSKLTLLENTLETPSANSKILGSAKKPKSTGSSHSRRCPGRSSARKKRRKNHRSSSSSSSGSMSSGSGEYLVF